MSLPRILKLLVISTAALAQGTREIDLSSNTSDYEQLDNITEGNSTFQAANSTNLSKTHESTVNQNHQQQVNTQSGQANNIGVGEMLGLIGGGLGVLACGAAIVTGCAAREDGDSDTFLPCPRP